MSKDRDGSVRARKVYGPGIEDRTLYHARYKYGGAWYVVRKLGTNDPMSFGTAEAAKKAAYAMYNVAINGGVHQ